GCRRRPPRRRHRPSTEGASASQGDHSPLARRYIACLAEGVAVQALETRSVLLAENASRVSALSVITMRGLSCAAVASLVTSSTSGVSASQVSGPTTPSG